MSNYTMIELLKEMRETLKVFSRLYEQPDFEQDGLIADDGSEYEFIIKIHDLRRAHFFCRHRDVAKHLNDPLPTNKVRVYTSGKWGG